MESTNLIAFKQWCKQCSNSKDYTFLAKTGPGTRSKRKKCSIFIWVIKNIGVLSHIHKFICSANKHSLQMKLVGIDGRMPYSPYANRPTFSNFTKWYRGVVAKWWFRPNWDEETSKRRNIISNIKHTQLTAMVEQKGNRKKICPQGTKWVNTACLKT